MCSFICDSTVLFTIPFKDFMCDLLDKRHHSANLQCKDTVENIWQSTQNDKIFPVLLTCIFLDKHLYLITI